MTSQSVFTGITSFACVNIEAEDMRNWSRFHHPSMGTAAIRIRSLSCMSYIGHLKEVISSRW